MILLVSWVGSDPDKSYEQFLALGADNNLAFGSRATYGNHQPRIKWADAIKRASDIKPYGWQDILIDPSGLSNMVADHAAYQTTFDAFQNICIKAQILFDEISHDEALSKIQVGRNLTLCERSYLLGNAWRVQAVNAQPWLLPMLVMAEFTAEDKFEEVTAAIDAGTELLPVLQKILKVPARVIRTMRGMPCWLPKSHRDALNSAIRPDRVAPSLVNIPHEKHPCPSSWARYLETLAWLNAIWQQHGEPMLAITEDILTYLMSNIWPALLRRPLENFPEPYQYNWLPDLRSSLLTHPIGGKLLFGKLDGVGKELCLPSETWAILLCLTRHPDDLPVVGRRWDRLELPYLRGAVGEAFSDCRLPTAINKSISLATGHRLVSIKTVNDLVKQSQKAQNCLPSYLPDLLAEKATILAIIDDEGMLVGHAEIRQAHAGNYEPGARRAIHNLALNYKIDAAVQFALVGISRQLDARGFLNKPAHESVLYEMAVNVIRQTMAKAHFEEAARIMFKAGSRFKLHHKNDPSHAAQEITWFMQSGELGLARKIAARHGAVHFKGRSLEPQLEIPSVAKSNLSRSQLPNGADIPDSLVLPFLPYFLSPIHDGDITSARQVLGSYSLDFSQKHKVIQGFQSFTQFQVDALREVFIEEAESFDSLSHEFEHIALLSARNILDVLLLATWYGINVNPLQEASLLRFMLKRSSRSVTRKLTNLTNEYWSKAPLAAYVFRHLLPSTHPAWIIGERAASTSLISSSPTK